MCACARGCVCDVRSCVCARRTPEQNVQNGVLKTMSFLFEYIGEMAKDYINAVVPLFEDALMDRDLIHRQTASFAIKHMGLGGRPLPFLCVCVRVTVCDRVCRSGGSGV